MNDIDKLIEGRQKSLNLNFKGLQNKQNGRLRCEETKRFEFEFKGLEIDIIEKPRCEEGNAVSWAQQSGPLLLVLNI